MEPRGPRACGSSLPARARACHTAGRPNWTRSHRHSKRMPVLRMCREPARAMKASLAGAICFWSLLQSAAPAAPVASVNAPVVQPWRRVPLDPASRGMDLAGDLDGDRQAGIVSARNVDRQRRPLYQRGRRPAARRPGVVALGEPARGPASSTTTWPARFTTGTATAATRWCSARRVSWSNWKGATGTGKAPVSAAQRGHAIAWSSPTSPGPRATDVLVKTRYTPDLGL